MENRRPSAVVAADATAGPDETERRTGVAHSLPCTASEDATAPVCQLFHQLPSWNRALWHISMQLQLQEHAAASACSCKSEDQKLLVDALRSFTSKSTMLKTLDVSELVVGNVASRRLSASLKRNCSVTKLSVRTSILLARSD